MTVGRRRRRSELAVGFTRWLRAHRPAWGVEHVEVTRPQSGLSSETVFVDAHGSSGVHALVARMPPLGDLLFPDYDLGRQLRVQTSLVPTTVPVAEPLVHEQDPDHVGAPFLLMARVPGRTLTTSPPYSSWGWLRDSSDDVQARVLRQFVETLADIHRLPPATGLQDLTGGGPTLTSSLDYWDDYLTWATSDRVGSEVYRDALAWCRDHLPASAPPSLLWGDPQLVNVVFDDDGAPAAVLDWELASRGPAEADLAWFLSLHEAVDQTAGASLPGFPDRDVLVGWYEVALGRPVQDLAWHEVFAHVRSGAVVLRVGELMRRAGADPSWTSEVPQPRELRRRIGA